MKKSIFGIAICTTLLVLGGCKFGHKNKVKSALQSTPAVTQPAVATPAQQPMTEPTSVAPAQNPIAQTEQPMAPPTNQIKIEKTQKQAVKQHAHELANQVQNAAQTTAVAPKIPAPESSVGMNNTQPPAPPADQTVQQ